MNNPHNHRTAFIVALLLVAVSLNAAAESYDPNVYQSLEWRLIGPHRGGRVTTAVGVPGQENVYYQGATGGGVWKTTDAGLSWKNISDGFFKTGSVGAIAVAPSNPNVLYVGMGEVCIRSNFSHGDGVYKSTDAGKTWTHIGLSDSRQIGQIRIHPENPDLVYVAALGHVFGPNEERGVFRSKDGGNSWEKILYINDKTGAVDLSLDVTRPDVIYAAMWQVIRKPWGILPQGPGSGIYKTTNGGDSWEELTGGLPGTDLGRIGVSVSPINPNRVWALVEADGGDLFLSDDAGANWSMVNHDFHLQRRPYYYGHIYADSQEVDTVYVLTSPFMKSIDAGKSFEHVEVPHGDNHNLWIAPDNNKRMINANDGGANVSFDGGKSWSRVDNQPTAQFYWVITDDRFPYRVYGAQQDNTTVSIASRTATPGIAASDWYAVAGGESGYIAPKPGDPDVTYGGSYWGFMTRHDRRNGENRDVSPWPARPMGRVGAGLKYRFNWTYPIVISPHDPNTVYVGANVLFRSTNEGQTWDAISPDLTHDDKSKQQLARLSDFYCTITSITESKLQKGLLWVGSDDGRAHLTRNGGRDWLEVTPPEMEAWSRINLIESSPHEAGSAYMAVNRYHLDDYRPYIYKTKDFGQSWKLVGKGIAEDAFVRTVREDPERRGLLYAGTETGVYVSWDDGENWQSLQRNLPVVPITDLAVKNDDLVAATQGRAFWILDDLTALHQLTPDAAASPVFLFEPRAAYRVRRGRSFLRDPNVGQNPPDGVIVDFLLQEGSDEASLEFLDADGTIIKTFSSSDEASNVTAEKGLNRFVWDLRYPDGSDLTNGSHLFGGNLRGPMAVPGIYRVRLTAAGETKSASFEIKKDPRVAATREDLQAQFDLLIEVRDGVSDAHQAANKILAVKKRLQDVSPGNENIDKRLKEVDGKLTAVLDELVEFRFRGIDDQMLVYPLQLNAKIASLQRVVASAEHRPTDQSVDVFRELRSQLDTQLSRVDAIMANDVKALNRLLRDKGLREVSTDRAEPE